MWIFTPHFSKFRTFGMLHPPKWHMFLEFLVKNKAFCFSKRALRPGAAGNKWFKKALIFQEFFFYSSFLIGLHYAVKLTKRCGCRQIMSVDVSQQFAFQNQCTLNPNKTGLFEGSFFWGRVILTPWPPFIFQEELI